jgi:integrase
MGLRASEILQRKVRDLDDDCGILWIDSGKTRNAKRHLQIPEFLRPHLRELVGNQSQDAYLFVSSFSGKPVRHPSLWTAVQRLCLAAGATAVSTHSLRGLYATLAVESGALSETVASSLGHGSFAMTEKHYAQASVVSNVRTARVDQLLTSGRATEPMGVETITQLVQKMSPQQRAEMMKAMSLPHQSALPSNP